MLISKDRFYVGLASLLVFPYIYVVTQVVFVWRVQSLTSDISNYVSNYDRYIRYLHARTETWLGKITNEVSFHILYYRSSEFFGDPLIALQVLSGICSAVIFFAVLPKNRSQVIFLFLLLHPRVLDLVSSQIRFALAISVFLLVLKYSQTRLRGFLVLPISTVHTFFLVASSLTVFFDFFFKSKGRFGLYVQTILIACVLVFGAEAFLYFIGDRRAEGVDVNKSFGIAYLLMTTLTFGVVLHANRDIIYDLFGFLMVVVFFASVFTSLVGGYAERYVASSFLFFLAYASRNNLIGSGLLALVFLLNFSFSLLYWL